MNSIAIISLKVVKKWNECQMVVCIGNQLYVLGDSLFFFSFLFGSHHIHKTRGPHCKLTCDVHNIDAFLCGYSDNMIRFYQTVDIITTSSTSSESDCIKEDSKADLRARKPTIHH
jgi:hypothetical protein